MNTIKVASSAVMNTREGPIIKSMQVFTQTLPQDVTQRQFF